MKQKYLALAISAIVSIGLVGCGSDSDSNYIPPTPDVPGDNGGNTGGETGGENGGETGGENGGETGGGSDPTDNPGGAANAGEQSKKPSVVGQQYIRGENSNFDRTPATNSNPNNNGNATVVGFETLQNEKMTNIVVAQFADQSNVDANGNPNNVKYLLGAAPTANPQVTNPNSLQNNNDASQNGENLGTIVRTEKNQAPGAGVPTYTITGQESQVGTNTNITQTGGAESSFSSTTDNARGNDVRIFGHLSTTATETEMADPDFSNSARYLVKDANGNKIDLQTIVQTVPVDPNDSSAGTTTQNFFDNEGLKLNNVQYGRVTGQLDNLLAADIAGQSYVVAPLADKNFAGNNTQTDVYFYRGVGETTLAQMQAVKATGGKYQYAGHALMYGIDNSYNGEQGSGGSNSVAFGNTGVGIGNFVQAEYDADKSTVVGSVYNVWDKGAEDGSLEQVDLVDFAGGVVGNSIVNGTADRTYIDGLDNAAFKGSFFGDNAEELGGSFNSITTGYGNSQWGGVFGAQQVGGAPVVGLPPINGVE